MSSHYAWIIDRDHLTGPGGEFANPNEDEKGVMGPRDADVAGGSYEDNKAELTRNYKAHNQFRMYDDDGILYYTGTLYHDGEPDEEACYGPLGDFGMPNAGAVLIKYTGQPGMDCG